MIDKILLALQGINSDIIRLEQKCKDDLKTEIQMWEDTLKGKRDHFSDSRVWLVHEFGAAVEKRKIEDFIKVLEDLRPYNNIYGEGMNKRITETIKRLKNES